MANGVTHRLVAAAAVGGTLLQIDVSRGERTAKPLIGAGLAAVATNLPDLLEPAIHPHHRQFFHSVVFAAGVGFGLKKAYDWDAQQDWEKVVRFLILVAGSAYLIHLALDAVTARSLPLVGKL